MKRNKRVLRKLIGILIISIAAFAYVFPPNESNAKTYYVGDTYKINAPLALKENTRVVWKKNGTPIYYRYTIRN